MRHRELHHPHQHPHLGLTGRQLLGAHSIDGQDIRLRSTLGGSGSTIADVDHLVLCGYDARPADDLYFALLERVPSITRIGDAVSPRTVDRAIFDGHLAGRAI